jgi:hypothetical protein
MKHFLLYLIIAALSLLSACRTTAVPLKVHEINSLSQAASGEGEFQGLEFLADVRPGELKARVNIFYVHGIGWTEDPDAEQIAEDFLGGIAAAYGKDVKGQIIKTRCGEPTAPGKPAANAVFLTPSAPKIYGTGLAGSSLSLERLACMDKQRLEVDPALEFVVYRVFWDDIFWNSFQFAHVGQDDDQGSSSPFANLRRKYNRRLKDELINYGISDAVMYLGPAGADIRRAVEGAMCSAALDAAGFDFARQAGGSDSRNVNADQICKLAENTSTVSNQFAFVTESLGSKIVFDVLRQHSLDGQDGIIDRIINGSETYMLANQIALLSLSDLKLGGNDSRPAQRPQAQRPKIIAMSEINDFLTYELIPFYQQLYKRSTRPGGTPDPASQQASEEIMSALGFDMVDMRLEFADKLVPLLKGFVDPLQAHGGHASEPELMLYMLCGARGGALNREGCLATELANENNPRKRKGGH